MLDHYHAERLGTKYKDQSTTEIETSSHGSEVCNCRVQRVFFSLLAGSRSRLRRSQLQLHYEKKNPLAPRVTKHEKRRSNSTGKHTKHMTTSLRRQRRENPGTRLSTWSMKITSFALNNLAPQKFFGGGQIRVDERSKILDCDRLMKAFFVERNNNIRECKRNYCDYIITIRCYA